jgi:tetratricopeptide (TPR) repeat protein
VKAVVFAVVGLLVGIGAAADTPVHRAAERAQRLNQLLRDLDAVSALIVSNQCQAAQNRLDEIAAAFDECAELAAAPRICQQIGPLLVAGHRDEALQVLDFNRIAVTNSLVLSVLVSRLQTQICGAVVADLEATRLERYRTYQTALQRLTAAREERDLARSRQDKLEKALRASLEKNARDPMLEVQILQAKRDYQQALSNVAAAEAVFQRVMRAHARAFAQLGLGNSLLAEYQEMVVNAEFSVAEGPRIRHTAPRLEELPRVVATATAPTATVVEAAASRGGASFWREYRRWILGGGGALVLGALLFFVRRKSPPR